MKNALQITFRNMDPSDEIKEIVQGQARKLESFYDRIMSCRVVVEVPHRHHQRGSPRQVRVDLRVPGKELAVTKVASLHGFQKKAKDNRTTKVEETNTAHKYLIAAIHESFAEAGSATIFL